MHSSTKSRSAFHLDSLEPGRNALLFYDNERTLESFLFNYVKVGLQKGETVFYWAGIRTVEEAEQKMATFGIDCDYYKKNGMLHLTTYDEMFLADGRLDILGCHKKLFDMIKAVGNGRTIRLATESNWWLLADLFEHAFDMESGHDLIPHVLSAVCSYNIANLMKYANIYHLAKLMELHNYTVLATGSSVMPPGKFYSYLGKSIISVLEDNFDYLTIVRRKHSRFISEVLLELEMRIGSDMLELERNVEERLLQILKLE